jgi:hypothetical protein
MLGFRQGDRSILGREKRIFTQKGIGMTYENFLSKNA